MLGLETHAERTLFGDRSYKRLAPVQASPEGLDVRRFQGFAISDDIAELVEGFVGVIRNRGKAQPEAWIGPDREHVLVVAGCGSGELASKKVNGHHCEPRFQSFLPRIGASRHALNGG